MGDPEVGRWLRPRGRGDPLTLAECEDWARRHAAHWETFGYGEWLVLDADAPVARGGLGHTVVAGRAEVELGWAVAVAHQGRGIATRLALDGLAVAEERR